MDARPVGSPRSYVSTSFSCSSSARLSNSLDYGNSVFGFMFGFGFYLDSLGLPGPWFIYSIMGVGILLCCITLIGCMAAESSQGCCLCFYTILKTVLILLEVALVAFIAFDHQWEKVLSLLQAMVLRGLVSPRRTDLEDEDYENVKGRTREPLPHQASQTSSAGTHSDTWSSRMREKYGLNSGEKSSLLNQNVSVSMKTK